MSKIQRSLPIRELTSITAKLSLVLLSIFTITQSVWAQTAAQQAALNKLNQRSAAAYAMNTGSSNTASNAQTLEMPSALAYDSTGNLYIADMQDHEVLLISTNGLVSVVAGNGTQGFSGDGGAATSAQLDSPSGIAVSSSGLLYIADTNNNRIRLVSSGVISTIAGTGVAGFAGDGAAATAAKFFHPTALALDGSGSYYVVDSGNNRVRQVVSGVINTVAGNGNQGYTGDGGLATLAALDTPYGIAVDSSLNIYISDTNNQRVRVVNHATGMITTVAGTGTFGFNADGTATNSALARPLGLAVNSAGTVYLADSGNHRIRSISGGQLSTIAGSGTEGFKGDMGVASGAQLDTPRAVAVYQSTVAVADTQNQAVRVVSNGGIDTLSEPSSSTGESLVISGTTTSTYGSGSITATFISGSNVASGNVAFYDGLGSSPTLLGTSTLVSNVATLSTTTLAAGTHALIASYAGDTTNAAINSGVYTLTVTPVALTAVANSVSQPYGVAIPALSGNLSGVLSQDSGKVSAVYTTTATITSSPGTYAISSALSGVAAGNYTVSLGQSSGSFTIVKAGSALALTSSASTSAYGASVTLTATATSATSGTPTGNVIFWNGSTQLNSGAALSNGVATFSLNTLPVGSDSITAVYAGDTNFNGSNAAAQNISVLAPTVSASQSALAFGSQAINATSAAQTIILTNGNGLPLTVSSITASGDYAASSSCTSIPANGSCSINVTFTPQSTGSRSGTLTVAVALVNGSITIPLSGTGTAAGLQISPALLNFGSQTLSTSSYAQTITIQNTGNATLVLSNVATTGDFATTGNCATVQAGSSCNLSVVFTPTAVGNRTGSITLTDNVGNSTQSQVINLSGTGTQAGASLSPSSASFPSTLVGTPSFAQTVTLSNSGTATLTNISISIAGDFSQTNTCLSTLAASASCTISIVYSPTTTGSESGLLSITNNLGTQTVTLSGTGIAPGATLSTAQIVYGGQLVNTSSKAQTIVFTNSGTAPVNIKSVTPTAGYTDTTNCTGAIAAGASCSVNILFLPTTTGTITGTLTISTDAGTKVVTLQGLGISPGLSVAPSFAIFGAQIVGSTSQAQTFVALNTGNAPLTLSGITVSTNFIESDQCPSVLQAGASCLISLSFAPTATGTLLGNMLISDTSGQIQTMVTTSGQGTLPGIQSTPSALSFGSLPIGTSSQAQTITVTNSGTAPLLIGTVSGTGDFSEVDTCSGQSIAAGKYCVISVTMTPTTIGTRTGIIQFTNNVDGLHSVALSGVGQQAGVNVYPTGLAFGSAPVNTQSSGTSLSVTVANTGNVALTLSSITTQGDFSESDSCNGSVAVGGTCTLSVSFLPTALGHRTGTLTINDNAGGGTQVVSLQGDGAPAGLILTPSVLNFGVQSIGVASKVQTATLTNNTGQNVTGLTIVASGEYSETDNCGSTLASGTACTLQISVTPATSGTITGTIAISSGNSIAVTSQLQRSIHAMTPEIIGFSKTTTTTQLGVVALMATSSQTTGTATQLSFGTAPATSVVAGGNAGAAITVLETDNTGTMVNASDVITLTVTGASGYSATYTATASGGAATFNLASAALTTAGSYSYAAAVTSNSSIRTTSSSESVISAAAASVTLSKGSNQNAVILSAFSIPLQVVVQDRYGNLVSGATVVFTAPTSGASAVLSSASATTNSSGVASITATANGVAGSFSITASVSGATSATFALTNTKGTPVLSWNTPSSITYGTALSATQLNATASVPGTFVYTPAAGTILSVGSSALSVSFTPTDTADYLSTSTTSSINVTSATAGVVVTASTASVFLQNPVTYTVTVSGVASGTIPTGTVTLMDGSTALGSVALNSSGVATLTASPTTTGTHSITAVYGGNTAYSSVTSAAYSELAQDFALNLSTASDAQVNVLPGATATYSFTVLPTNGTNLPGAVTLTTSGAPQGATVVLSASAISAGSTNGSFTLSITPSKQNHASQLLRNDRNPFQRLLPISMALILVPLFGMRRARKLWRWSALAVILLVGMGLTGCGGAAGYFGQAPSSYTITVTATSGALSHSTNVTLTVQ